MNTQVMEKRKTMMTGRFNMNGPDARRLVEGKTGGKWCGFVLVPTPNSKYGDDFMIVQEVSKDERLAGTRGNILGNVRIHEY